MRTLRPSPLRHAALLSACAALSGLTCHARANPPDAFVAAHEGADAAVPATTRVRGLREAALTETADVVRVRALEAASTATTVDERTQFQWLAASLDTDTARAKTLFRTIAASDAPLASWAGLEAARASLEAEPRAARALLATTLERAGTSWPGAREAQAIDALAAARLDAGDAEPLLRSVLEAPPSLQLDRQCRRALADQLGASSSESSRREAIGLYQDLLATAPNADSTRGAREALEALVAGFPDEEREALRTPTLAQARAHAAWLASTQQHRAAAQAYADLADALPRDTLERCTARLEAGRALHRGRAHAAAISTLQTMLDECEALPSIGASSESDRAALEDTIAWGHYMLGRSALSSQRAGEGIQHLREIARRAPSHRLADDALVYVARAETERGERSAALEALAAAASLGGDMRGEARFLAAWNLRHDGHLEGALASLDQSLAEGTGEASEGLVGRAAYWRGRILGESGRTSDAIAAFRALAVERPLTYYGQQALGRLHELAPAEASAVRASLLANHAPRSATPPDLAPFLGNEDAARAAARALALLAVGEVDRAERELAPLGLRGDGSLDAAVTWTALLEQTGHAHRATDIARRRISSTLAAPMDTASLALWRTAYPRAYAGLIEDAANQEGVDPSFVRAVAREESSFNPEAVSVAHAYGLLQLIRSTAQRHGRAVGLPSDAEALTQPAINVRIGAHYMGSLRRRYDGHAALIPPAYNAGEGAVDRWIRERPDQAFDAWVEEIPYAETRGYTRRVLQSWIVYGFLDRGELPELPTALPRRAS